MNLVNKLLDITMNLKAMALCKILSLECFIDMPFLTVLLLFKSCYEIKKNRTFFCHVKGRKLFMVTIEIFSDNSVKGQFQCEAAENAVAHND